MNDNPVSLDFLRKIPIFRALSDEALKQILESPDNGVEEYGAKQLIIRESEVASCMYVVLEGTVEVLVRGTGGIGREICVATLKKGDFFGDQSLNTDTTGRRSASVRTLHPAKLFRIDKKHVLLGLHKENADDVSEDITIPVLTPQDKETKNLIQGMRLFQSLKENELNTIGTWAKIVTVGPGDFVLKESEKGDCLYVVLEGVVEVFTFDENGKIVMLATLERGDHFGEQALMPGSSGERNAYARTNKTARLIQIPKAYFRLVLNRDSELARALKRIGEKQKTTIDHIQKS
jgi:CRP-like cAMP-binding protein